MKKDAILLGVAALTIIGIALLEAMVESNAYDSTEKLTLKMNEAAAKEDYSMAAKIRDEIKRRSV